MRIWAVLIFLAMIAAGVATLTQASVVPTEHKKPSLMIEFLRKKLSETYPNARIVLSEIIQWSSGEPSMEALDQVSEVSVLEESARGDVHFAGHSQGAVDIEGWAHFAAYVPALYAVRRIMPGDHLVPESLVKREVDVASGLAHEYRGVILAPETDILKLEARQSILEGSFVMSSSVQKTPDIKRGESVRIEVLSGDVKLRTTGVAEEPAYIAGQIRVLTGKAKRELVGKLMENGVVEVKL